jgi:hypothetical protein
VWAEGTQVKVIDEEAFEDTQLNELMISWTLQYIGSLICLSKMELLLTRESRMRKFEEWKTLFVVSGNEMMGKLTAHEMEEDA